MVLVARVHYAGAYGDIHVLPSVYPSGWGPTTKHPRGFQCLPRNLGVLGMGAVWHGVRAPRVAQCVAVECP